MVENYSLSLATAYFQILIYDAKLDYTQVEDSTNWWAEEDHRRMLSLKEANKLLVMGTFRDFTVPVNIAVFREKPKVLPLVDWDQVNECSLMTQMGTILIRGLFDDETESLVIKGPKPCWRIRLYYGGQTTIDAMGLEGQDHCRLELWPTEAVQELAIIKQRVLLPEA